MATNSILPPYPLFHDDEGNALEAGYIYVGIANLDPVTNPISVFWDVALSVPVSQPIRTVAGYPENPSNPSDPAIFYVGSNYSIEVQNRNQVEVYSAASDTTFYTGGLGSVSSYTELRALTGMGTGTLVRVSSGTGIDGLFRYDSTQSGTDDGGVIIGGWVRQRAPFNDSVVFVKWFEAVGDGVADDTAAQQAAITFATANDGTLIYTDGAYSTTSTLTSDASNTRSIKIIANGLVRILWNGGNNDIVFDLRRWANTCEFSGFILENTIQATGCTGIRLTCWTGSGTTLSGVVDMPYLHDLEVGATGDLGFEYGIRFGDKAAYGSGEFFTYVNLERFFGRHNTYSIYIDSTTFDLCMFKLINCNGGGSASGGSDANATTHIKSTGPVGRLLIDGFNSNRCTSYPIDLVGGEVYVRGGWMEDSGGGFRMTASGSAAPSILDNVKFTIATADGSGNSVDYNATTGSTLTVRNCEFNVGNVYVRAEQQLIHYGNEFLGGATVKRIDNRFMRTYNRRPLGQSAPHWERIELQYTDFDAASTTIVFDIPVSDEPTSTVIHDVMLRSAIKFEGGSVSAATLAFGISTDATGFFTGANVFSTGPFRLTNQSDLGTLLWDTTDPSPRRYVMTGAKTLRATLTLTGDNGDALTAGTCHIFLLTSALYAAEEYYPEIIDTIAGSS